MFIAVSSTPSAIVKGIHFNADGHSCPSTFLPAGPEDIAFSDRLSRGVVKLTKGSQYPASLTDTKANSRYSYWLSRDDASDNINIAAKIDPDNPDSWVQTVLTPGTLTTIGYHSFWSPELPKDGFPSGRTLEGKQVTGTTVDCTQARDAATAHSSKPADTDDDSAKTDI